MRARHPLWRDRLLIIAALIKLTASNSHSGLRQWAFPAPMEMPVDRFPKGHSMNCTRLVSILLLAAGTALAQAQATPQADADKPVPPQVIKSFDPSAIDKTADRSEEHTSELQSLRHL